MSAKRTESSQEWFGGAARLIDLKRHVDARGALLPIEFDGLPFTPQRLFTVAGVSAGTERGGHAHRDGQQFLVCLQGEVELCLRRRDEEVRLRLRPDGPGLLLGSLVWCRQTYLQDGTVLLVVASRAYDATSYVEDWRNL
jgi:hypothetical protein